MTGLPSTNILKCFYFCLVGWFVNDVKLKLYESAIKTHSNKIYKIFTTLNAHNHPTVYDHSISTRRMIIKSEIISQFQFQRFNYFLRIYFFYFHFGSHCYDNYRKLYAQLIICPINVIKLYHTHTTHSLLTLH